MQDLRVELTEAIDEAEWNWLAPHARRDCLIVVSSDLDLVEVGMAIANDNIPYVQRWIEEALIHKPSASELSTWNENQDKRFSALIVQPYVLIQELA